jgi:hypothetical protein
MWMSFPSANSTFLSEQIVHQPLAVLFSQNTLASAISKTDKLFYTYGR